MATRQKKDPDGLINYLVATTQGEIVIQVQANWKLTFGAVNPGAPPHGRDLHCLRVWEGEKLRAVICDVRSFRDLSIPLMRKVQKETGSATWTADSEGNFESNESRQIEASWSEPERVEDIPF